MKCPIDNTELLMAERQGVEIDYCPKCRGVWLDRGELDKIIEQTNTMLRDRRAESYEEDEEHEDADRRDERRGRRRRRFWEDLFDFG